MTITLRPEHALTVHGVEARAFAVIAADDGRIMNQQIKATRYYKERGHDYRITVTLRFDDEYRNGHETFAITADIREDGREYMGGCCHDEIAQRFPELAHLIPWHLCSTNGPLHYLANTVYLAGNRDCWGRRKSEVSNYEYGVRFNDSPVTHRLPGEFWKFLKARYGTGEFIRSEAVHDRDPKTYGVHYSVQGYGERWHEMPWRDRTAADEFIAALNTCRVEWVQIPTAWSEGKARELDAARRAAMWPEATDEELSAEPDALRVALTARLPDLIARFRAAMTAAGFIYPQRDPASGVAKVTIFD